MGRNESLNEIKLAELLTFKKNKKIENNSKTISENNHKNEKMSEEEQKIFIEKNETISKKIFDFLKNYESWLNEPEKIEKEKFAEIIKEVIDEFKNQ